MSPATRITRVVGPAALLLALAACTAGTPANTAAPVTSAPGAPSSAPAAPTTPPAQVITRPTPPATTAPAPSPTRAVLTLGAEPPLPAASGFGEVEPDEIDFGSHPTTILRDVEWESWGGATAEGTAQAVWVGPGQATAEGTFEDARVEAYEVGTCDGKPAYTRLKWWFPGHESDPQPTPFDLCTGVAVG